MSAISRCAQTIAQDNRSAGANYDADDRFCLDGQRLVSLSATTSATYGAASTEYRTEKEGFAKITASSSTIAYSSCPFYSNPGCSGSYSTMPQSFTVKTKAGLTMEYGVTTDSRILAQGKSTVIAWALSKVTDVKGNYYTITYTQDTGTSGTGEWRPTRMDYTGNGASAPTNSVQFVYETRTDQTPFYQMGSKSMTTMRVSKIQTYAGANLVKEYRLTYTQTAWVGSSALASLVECNAASVCLAPLSMTWQNNVGIQFNRVLSDASASGQWPESGGNRNFAVDINGDGKTDLLWIGSQGTYVELGQGDGSFVRVLSDNSPNAQWPEDTGNKNYLADINGDGKVDLVWIGSQGTYASLGQGDGTFVRVFSDGSVAGQWSENSGNRNHLVDVNGDGKVDLVWIGSQGTYVALGVGDGTFVRVFSDGTVASQWPEYSGNRNNLVDVNGDGKIDLVWIGSQGTYVSLGKGDGTFVRVLSDNSPNGQWPEDGGNRSFFTDVNGDGKIDFVWIGSQGTYVSLGKGDGTFVRVLSDGSPGGQWAENSGNYNYVVDLNGDGKADLLWVGTQGTYVSLGRGDGVFYRVLSDPSATTGQWPTDSGNRNILADVNGDGKTDFIWIGSQGTYVQVSAGVVGPLAQQFTSNLASLSVTYKPLSNSLVYKKDTGSAYPLLDIMTPMHVVSQADRSNGLGVGGIVSTAYSYGGLKGSVDGHGALGFRWMETKDVGTGIRSRTEFRQDYPYTGLTDKTCRISSSYTTLWQSCDQIKAANGLLGYSAPSYSYLTTLGTGADTSAVACPLTAPTISAGTGTGATSGSGVPSTVGKRYFVYDCQTVEQGWDYNGAVLPVVTTKTTYDDWGNVKKIRVQSDDGYCKATDNAYLTADSANWILGRLSRAQVTNKTPPDGLTCP